MAPGRKAEELMNDDCILRSLTLVRTGLGIYMMNCMDEHGRN